MIGLELALNFSFPFSFLPHFLSVELSLIGEWWIKGWESDDEMVDGALYL